MDFVRGDVTVCVRPLRPEEFSDVPEPMPEVYIADSIRKRRWRKVKLLTFVKGCFTIRVHFPKSPLYDP